MEENKITVINASTVQEVLYHLKNTQNLQIFAGATLSKKHVHGVKIKLPSPCIFVGHIEELKEINRTERFIEFGSAVTINQILELGKTRIPYFLYEAASLIASHNVGNLATIGGNICNVSHRMSLFSPLLALDASLEFRSFSDSQIITLTKFTEVPKGFFLTKIRVPVLNWRTERYVKLGSPYEQNEKSASFTFLADSSKSSYLGDLRIAFAGEVAFRSQELENTLIGSRLPLTDKDCAMLVEKASKLYDSETQKYEKEKNVFLKSQFLSLLEQSLDELMHF